MKSLRASLILVAAATACIVLAGQAPTKKTFQSYFDKYNSFVLKKDAAGLEKFMRSTHTSDYKSIDHKKASSLEDEIGNMHQLFQQMSRFSQAKTTVDKVVAGNGTASVTTSTVVAGSISGHKMVITDHSVDVFVKAHGMWMRKLSKSDGGGISIDGKTVKQ